jgi:hypothetical protein
MPNLIERLRASGLVRPGAVIVAFADGRLLDITGLDPAAAIATLRADGVTTADIETTVHILDLQLPLQRPEESA